MIDMFPNMESPFFLFALFMFGLAFGSFLNVVALRYQETSRIYESSTNIRIRRLLGRSRCMKCKTQLRWFELIPLLSFLFLRGRCRTCREKISWQYPIVELLGGLVFVSIPFYFFQFFQMGNMFAFKPEFLGAYLFMILWIAVFWTLLLMSVIDMRTYLIPNGLNIMLGVFGVFSVMLKVFFADVFLPFQLFFMKSYAPLFQFSIFGKSDILGMSDFLTLGTYHVFGSLVVGGFFWAIYAVTREKGIGFGDVKLGFALGFLLGWPDIFFAAMFAFIVGGVVGSVLIFTRRKGRKRRVPFGAFFAVGVMILVFAGHPILEGYFRLFNIWG